MMQPYILDTSFVMAYIIQSDSNHDRVIRWSATIHLDESVFYISDFIYAELLTVINRKTPGIYTQSLDAFMAGSNVRMISHRLHEYLAYYNQFETKLSVCDMSIVYDSVRLGAIILSCDEALLIFAQTQQ